MREEKTLRLLDVTFITKDGVEIEKNKLHNEEYQMFCDSFESSRMRYKIVWHEFDQRYIKQE